LGFADPAHLDSWAAADDTCDDDAMTLHVVQLELSRDT
jgi:hypothetical protein